MNEKEINYFDLHCDTLTRYYHTKDKQPPEALHITPEGIDTFAHFSQVFAVFTSPRVSPEDSRRLFRDVTGYFKDRLLQRERFTPYLSVENAQMLEGDIGFLDTLAESGVCLITPVWGGMNALGGAHNTDEGLTPFGKDAMQKAIDLGMLPDVSHASDKTFRDIAEICHAQGKPIVATHSDSRTVCRHSRNLTDAQFREIAASGGIVGISLCTEHLSEDERSCDIDKVIDHVAHYMSLGGENTVCFGCDLDGIDDLPQGMCGVADVALIKARMAERGFSAEETERILHANAQAFFKRNGIKPLGAA